MNDGPNFLQPPVVEVALGLQFQPLEKLGITQMADYRAKIRERFPQWVQAPALVAAAAPPSLQFSLGGIPQQIRSMYLDSSETHLIQVQNDRFVFNWRKIESEHQQQYPRYPVVRERFEEELLKFSSFVVDEGLGQLAPNGTFVTYVNHIEQCSVWSDHSELDRLLTVFSGEHSDSFLTKAVEASVALKYSIPGPTPASEHLQVNVRPAFRLSAQQPIFRLDLVASTKPTGEQTSAILDSLDRGHDFLVSAFRSITTNRMHKIWGLKE